MMRCRHSLLLALTLLTGQVAVAAPAADCLAIALEPEVMVAGTRYRLADVARFDGGKCAELGALELGKAPRPGYWAHITRHQVAARIERRWPGSRKQIRWTGSQVVRVTATGESYPGMDVSRVAEWALREALQDRYSRVELEATRTVEDLIVPAGHVTLEAGAPNATAPAKRMSVWVDVSVDGEHYRSVPVWFAVSAWTRVVQVNRDLEHNHVLELADLAEATIDIAGLPGPPVMDPALAPGQRLVRPLSEGTVLLEKHIEPAPLVQQGAVVDVFAKAGRVVLRAKGVALSDGDLSQRIVVSNPKSGERFAAVVVGPGHVEAL